MEDQEIEMDVDTDTALSVINEQTYPLFKDNCPLKETKAILRTFTGERIKPLGAIEVAVEYQQQQKRLPLLVMRQGANMMGRNWLSKILMDWQKIQAEIRVHKILAGENMAVSDLLKEYEHLFKHELGKLKGIEATIHLQKGTTLIFLKSRPVPFTLREGIEAELERLEAQGTIKPVNHSDWATPIVPFEKIDLTVKICGNYKLTVNKASKRQLPYTQGG